MPNRLAVLVKGGCESKKGTDLFCETQRGRFVGFARVVNKSVPFSLVRNVDGAKTEVWLKWLGK